MSNESIFKINSVKTICVLSYNSVNTDCTICRCNLNSNSIFAKDGYNNSTIGVGMCGHSFHFECITPWDKKNGHCPICSKKWQLKRVIE